MNIRNNIETTRVVNSKINLSILKDASGELTINYTSSFNVIAYIDSKHYIK